MVIKADPIAANLVAMLDEFEPQLDKLQGADRLLRSMDIEKLYQAKATLYEVIPPLQHAYIEAAEDFDKLTPVVKKYL